MPETKEILISEIKIPEVRLNSILDDEQKTFLAASLQEVGVINDPVVRTREDGSYELVAGKSRIKELARLGIERVSCKILEVDKKTALKMNVIENVARGGWDYISMAKTIRELTREGADLKEVCRTFNRSESWVRRTLSLLDLPEKYQQAVKDGKLTPTHIQIALQLPTPQEVDALLQSVLVHGWSSSYVKTYVENRKYEINAAKKLADAQGLVAEIPPPRPMELVQYKKCQCCTYQYDVDQIQFMQICGNCIQLLKYITSQLGEPAKAMQIVYEAIREYMIRQAPSPIAPPGPTTDASGERTGP